MRRLIAGMRDGNRLPIWHSSASAWFSSTVSSRYSATRPRGSRRLVDVLALAAQRGARVREDVELEVVVRGRQLVEARERLLQRQRVVVAADREGRHHAEGHASRSRRGCRARRAPRATGPGRTRASTRPPSRPRSPARAPRPGSRCCRTARPCRGSRSRSRPRPSARRCRRGSRARAPRAASASLRSRITMPPSTFARPAPRSTSSTRFMRSRRSITPSVQAMSVNECPRPRPARLRPPSTARATALPELLDRRRAARPPPARTAGPRPSYATSVARPS